MPYSAAEFVFMILNSASPPVYESVANCTNLNKERSNSEEDVSTKGDAGDRRLYPEGAQRSVSVSVDFVAEDTALFNTLKTAAESNTPKILGRIDDLENLYTATWQISNWSMQGGPFGAITGSFTLSSSGAVTKASS